MQQSEPEITPVYAVTHELSRFVPQSTCCGLISLRTAMIITALIDITFGLSAGGLIYLIITTKLFAVTLSFKSFLTFVQAMFGIVCLTFMILYRET